MAYKLYKEKLDHSILKLKRHGLIAEDLGPLGIVIGKVNTSPSAAIDLTILSLIHGNEPGSLLVIHNFLENYLKSPFSDLRVAFLIGHPEAAKKNVRFIEKDLNRCFGSNQSIYLEDKIAKTIEPLILRSKFLIDIHQTNYETRSDFFIFPDNVSNINFAAELSQSTPIITHGLDFSNDGLTSDTFASLKGITAITYEMGQIGQSEKQLDKTLSVLNNALKVCRSGLAESAVKPKNILQFGQKITSSTQRRLIPNLINLAQVNKGEVLGYDENAGPIVAEHDGYVLFPKYGGQALKSSELCQLVRPL